MNRKKRRSVKLFILFVVILIFVVYINFFNGSFVYFTTGLGQNTVFKVEDQVVPKADMIVLFSDAKNQYEEFFGAEVWDQEIEGMNFAEYVKNQIRSKLIRINCMNILAKDRGVVLDRTETSNIDKAAKEFYEGLTDIQVQETGITEDGLKTLYNKFAVAKRLYDDMTAQDQEEISTDQARVIRIQYICAGTQQAAEEAKSRLDGGESFYTVVKEINQEDGYEYELRREEMEPVFEDAAFNLKTGETSDIVKCENQYYIIKCISDNEKTKTEANITAMLEKRKLENFNQTFESYEAGLFVEFNDELWEQHNVTESQRLSVNFENIFTKYFGLN